MRETGSVRRIFRGHLDDVLSVAFSPEGTHAVSGSSDGSLIFWQVEDVEDIVAWTYANKYIPQLSCDERGDFQLACETQSGG